MARINYLRIKVHDFILTNFLKKSGWALETPGPIGFKEEVVLSSKKFCKLFKENKAELYIQKDAWKVLVEKKADQKAGLKRQRAARQHELKKLAERIRKTQTRAQKTGSKNPKETAKLYAEMSRLQQEGARLQNDVAMLDRQIGAGKK